MCTKFLLPALQFTLILIVVTAERPNIVFILVDDLGASDTSFSARSLGIKEPPIPTPNIDWLAERGRVLTQHYTHPSCAPSRCALLTSRFSFNLGSPFPMFDRSKRSAPNTSSLGGNLAPEWNTVADELKARGYATHFIGKWGVDLDPDFQGDRKLGHFVGTPHKDYGPTGRGFDTFYGLYQSGHNHYTKKAGSIVDWHRFNATGRQSAPDLDPEPNEFSSRLFAREAVRIIQSEAQKVERNGFFLHLSFTAVHDPLQAPQELVADSRCARLHGWRRQTYCGMVLSVDEGVRDVVAALNSTSMLQDTAVVFSTDNGGFPFAGARNYPYRGYKTSVFNGGVKGPAFVYWPNALPARPFHGLMHLVDWGPTLLAFADKATPTMSLLGDVDGLDLSRALIGETEEGRKELVVEANSQSNKTVFVDGHWKLILGNPGGHELHLEPEDSWSLRPEERTPFTILREIVADVIRAISVDMSGFEWAFHFLVMHWEDKLMGNHLAPGDNHPHGYVDSIARDASGNVDFHFRSPHLAPTIDWANHSGLLGALVGKMYPRVWLFDLETDPFEISNLAFVESGRVLRMFEKVSYETKDVPPSATSVIIIFSRMMFIVQVVLGALASFCLLSALACCYCCCRCRCRSRFLQKEKTG